MQQEERDPSLTALRLIQAMADNSTQKQAVVAWLGTIPLDALSKLVVFLPDELLCIDANLPLPHKTALREELARRKQRISRTRPTATTITSVDQQSAPLVTKVYRRTQETSANPRSVPLNQQIALAPSKGASKYGCFIMPQVGGIITCADIDLLMSCADLHFACLYMMRIAPNHPHQLPEFAYLFAKECTVVDEQGKHGFSDPREALECAISAGYVGIVGVYRTSKPLPLAQMTEDEWLRLLSQPLESLLDTFH